MPTVKWRFGSGSGELREDRLDHRRGHLLRGEAVAPADHPRRRRERRGVAVHRLGQGGHDLEVQRLADRARLLGPVEDRDGPDGRRQGGQDLLGRERLEQADPQHPDPLAGRDEGVDRLLDGARRGAHDDDHPLGVRRAVVVDEAVPAAGPVARAHP